MLILKNRYIILSVFVLFSCGQAPESEMLPHYEKSKTIEITNNSSQNISIFNNGLGVKNIHGKTDRDVAFGMGFTQAEHNFSQLELAFIISIGRATEILGEQAILSDWIIHSFENNEISKRDYENAPKKIKTLLDSYTQGINYYIENQPNLQPRLLNRIEPWYPLALIRRWYYIGGFLSLDGFTEYELKAAFKTINGNRIKNTKIEIPNFYPKVRKDFNIMLKSANGSHNDTFEPHLYIYPHLPGHTYKINLVSDSGWRFTGSVHFGFPLPYIGFDETLDWHNSEDTNHEESWINYFKETKNSIRYSYNDSAHESKKWTKEIKIRDFEPITLHFQRTRLGAKIAMRGGKLLSANFVPYK